jgi:Fe-S-cluster containining protein
MWPSLGQKKCIIKVESQILQEYKHLLEKIRKNLGSGVQNFDKSEFEKLKKNKNNEGKDSLLEVIDEVAGKCLALFQSSAYSELLDYLYEDPSRISSFEIKSIKFLTEIKLGFKPSNSSFIKMENFYEYKKDLNFSEALIETANKLGIFDLDFFVYSNQIPQLVYSTIKARFYAYPISVTKDDLEDFLLKLENSFEKVKEIFESDSEVVDHYEERVLYLKALIFKKLENHVDAKKNIELYFEKSFTLEEKISKLVLIANQKLFSGDEVLTNLKKLYLESTEISAFIADTSLLTSDTCGAYGCDDCCRYTYPSLSLTEFEYIKNWASENKFDLSNAIEKSKKIQDDYKKLSGKYFQIESKEEGVDLNPEDFKFDCPFLESGRCSIHQARPLLCRVFGSGTTDAKYLKTCNYYLNQYQHMSSPEHERLVYDARGFQAMLEDSDKYLTQSDSAKTGLIPAFLLDFDLSQK